jgi:hypothetical protein
LNQLLHCLPQPLLQLPTLLLATALLVLFCWGGCVWGVWPAQAWGNACGKQHNKTFHAVVKTAEEAASFAKTLAACT